MANKASKKEDDRKGITYRVSPKNWLTLQQARLAKGVTMQSLLDLAVADYLKRHKLGAMEVEEAE